MAKISRRPERLDQQRGTVHVVASDGRIPAALDNLIDARTPVVVHTDTAKFPGADYAVTTGALNAAVERFAGRLSAMPVVLPEAADWLRNQITARTDQRQAVLIRLYNRNDI